MKTQTTPGTEAIKSKGWLLAHKWLIARRFIFNRALVWNMDCDRQSKFKFDLRRTAAN